MRHAPSFWVLTLVSTLVVVVPTTASGLTSVSETSIETSVTPSGAFGSNALDADTSDLIEESPTSTYEGTSTNELTPDNSNPESEELEVQGPIEPTGNVDVPTFEAVRLPGSLIPYDITTIIEDENTELLTFPDIGNFFALLKIDNADAATEYRFENAVPIDHTAILQPNGSVQFINSAGENSGGIAAPWAFDAKGSPVSTRYELDGSTLIQIVEHHGATYPVIADPAWFVVLVYITTYVHRCQQFHCITIAVGTVKTIKVIMDHNPPPRKRSAPTNTCNMRNRSGCNR